MQSKSWKHFNPVRIRFGRGCRSDILPILQDKLCLIVTSKGGRSRLLRDRHLSKELQTSKHIWIDSIEENPSLSNLQEQLTAISGKNIDAIIAIGGGSVIDSAKALAIALAPLVTEKSLESLIKEAPSYPAGSSLPVYALPTTAGTGSEVTQYATIWDHKEKRKLSLAGPTIYAHSAYVDPELTDSLPKEVTLSVGLDAINQAAESIWNKNMTAVSEAYAHKTLVLGFQALPELIKNPKNKQARDEMAEASLFSGMAISQTRTALCHSVSYPMTAHFGVPHGLACAFTMPAVLRYSLQSGDDRFSRLSELLGSLTPTAGLSLSLVNKFESLNKLLQVNERVRSYIPSFDVLQDLIPEMFTPGRSDNVIFPVDKETLRDIVKEAWHQPQRL